MSSNKAKIGNMQAAADLSLGKALLRIVAFGVVGGAALLGGAKAMGEKLGEKQMLDSEKLEAQREEDRENVRRIMENQVEAGYEPDDNTSEK